MGRASVPQLRAAIGGARYKQPVDHLGLYFPALVAFPAVAGPRSCVSLCCCSASSTAATTEGCAAAGLNRRPNVASPRNMQGTRAVACDRRHGALTLKRNPSVAGTPCRH